MNERTVTDLLSLDERVALVTGAAGWLGSAMSRGLAEAGASVVVTSRDPARAAEFAASLPGDGHIGLAFGQDDSESIPALVREVVERLGAIDVLVNNAYGGSTAGIESASAADFDGAYHTGVTTPFLLAREVAGHLRSRGAPGSIVNVASMYGVVASYPDAYTDVPINSPPGYHGLKGGLIQLTRHLAVYWAKDGIRVNAISPGPFPTSEQGVDMPEFIERLEQRVPMGRMGRPEELKGLIVLLASDAGAYLTGQNILVDGGWTAW
jgi:NAD(P)-dependent dehydrogenase (short-subunit alcohol dehydrogenase family)